MSNITLKKIQAIEACNVHCDGRHVAVVGTFADAPVMFLKHVSESQQEEIRKYCDKELKVSGQIATKKRVLKQPPPPPLEETDE